MPRLHPASRLLLWGAMVVTVQLARGPLLWGFGLFIAVLALAVARFRLRVLLRRIRYLLLVLVVLFAFFTPGESAIPTLGAASPSIEGLGLALTHGLRLLSVVMLVAILLEHTDEAELILGIMTLSRPLAFAGMSPERLAVRLMLVFRYVQDAPPEGWRGLLAAVPGPEREEGLVMRLPRPGWPDLVACAFVVGVCALGALG